MDSILVVDDDPFFLELVQTTLTHFQVVTATNGSDALRALATATPALITLDIQLNGEDGYSLCQQIRQQHPDLPILFVSSLDDLSSRLKAYGEGGTDYLTKPYQAPELVCKVERLIDTQRRQQALKHELSNNRSLIQYIQKEAAHLQTINRFIQSGMHCKDTDTLFALFFIALKDLGTSGVLRLNRPPHSLQACGEATSRLEREILEMSEQLPRIHAFGNDRALFHWGQATLLVRELGALIDVLAILMDALEMVLSTIETERGLVAQIAQLESANSDCQTQVEGLVSDMTLSLQDSLITLGLVSDLGEQEEKLISDIVDDYSRKIRDTLLVQQQHSREIRTLVEQLRSPSAEIRRLLEHAREAEAECEGSAVELF